MSQKLQPHSAAGCSLLFLALLISFTPSLTLHADELRGYRGLVQAYVNSGQRDKLEELLADSMRVLSLAVAATPERKAELREQVSIVNAGLAQLDQDERARGRTQTGRERNRLTVDDELLLTVPQDVRKTLRDAAQQKAALEQLGRKLEQEGMDWATKRAVGRIFGEAAAKVVDRLSTLASAIEPNRNGADATTVAEVRRWRDRCDGFVKESSERTERAKYLTNLASEYNQKARTATSRYEAQMFLDASGVALRESEKELAILKENTRAIVWCEDALGAMNKFLNNAQ